MNKFLLSAALIAAVGATPVRATEAVWDLTNPSGDLGGLHTYTADGFHVTAGGFDSVSTWGNIAIFAKTSGGDETGLGIKNDPSGNDEIWGTTFIQMDVSSAVAAGVTNFQFKMGSTTQGESWGVWGANTSGTGTVLAGLVAGNDDGTILHTLPGGYNFYDFFYTGGPPGGGAGGCGNGCNANVLLTEFQGLEPGVVTHGVPEPSTWAMMLGGFAFLGLAAFRRRIREATV